MGFTWSNNGVGEQKKRDKIRDELGMFMGESYKYCVEEELYDSYGIGNNMKVVFLKKKFF